jgi:hypothetical protein
MRRAILQQHPAVVLRSLYNQDLNPPANGRVS